jgi:segregation and condensation protein B
MAIVAYKQPVTKTEIEAIRGVDTSAVLATLLERNLITIRGRSKVVGRPLLYGTTPEFLDYFGLKDLTELPRPEELRALVAAREPEQLDMIELQVPAELAESLPEGPGMASIAEASTPEDEDLEDDEPDDDLEDEELDDDELDDDELEDDDLEDDELEDDDAEPERSEDAEVAEQEKV